MERQMLVQPCNGLDSCSGCEVVRITTDMQVQNKSSTNTLEIRIFRRRKSTPKVKNATAKAE